MAAARRARRGNGSIDMVPGWVQIAVVIILAVLLFGGRGKISSIMGDFAKGIKSFKKGMKEEPEEAEAKLENQAEDAIDVTPAKKEEGKA